MITRPSFHSLEEQLANVVTEVLRVPSALVTSGVAFAELGMDSLAAVELTAAIEDALSIELPMSAVHEHPTLDGLVSFIRQGDAVDALVTSRDRMRADAKLPVDIQPLAATRFAGTTRDARRVLLTGATGFVGAFLLRALADDTSADIHCLVRCKGPSSRSRLRASLEHYDLWSDDLDHRIHIVEGELSLPRLGLSEVGFEFLANEIDAIYHVGADVNWVTGYDGLRATNVLGTLEVLRLACTGGPKPLHFISSTSVCHSTISSREVDESLDPLSTIDGLWLGYAQSKCVAESLVREAGARGLPVTIVRPSLVSGDATRGRSNSSDLVSRFIAGCIAMRAAPDLDWRVDCVPVDDVAASIVRLTRAHEQGVAVFHLSATSPKHWRECVLWMRLSGYDIELVPYREWLAMLAETGDGNPLHPLRAFFARTIAAEEGLTLPELFEESRRAKVSDTRTRAALGSLDRSSKPLSTYVLSRYFDEFERVGLIQPIARRTRVADAESRAPSLDVVRPQLEDSLSRLSGNERLRIGAIELEPVNTDESIVAELAAWRGGTRSGLYDATVEVNHGNERWLQRLFVKSKPTDTEIIDVAESVAALASPALGETVSRFRDHLGFTRSHLREIALYADSDVRLRRHTPRVFATDSDNRARRWVVALESFAEMDYQPVAVSRSSPSEQIQAVVEGLARIHAVGFDRRTEFETAAWQAPRRTHTQRGAMIPLWSALATHALTRSAAWSDRRLRVAHERAIANLSAWSYTLESGKQTLIHNDFNPRNFVLRRVSNGLELCAYDWELATMGLPQRDLVECFAFMLPENAPRDLVARCLDHHRLALVRESGVELDRVEWEHGFRAALCDFVVDRLASYAMVDRVRRQAFLPRVARGWLNLYQQFPFV